MIHITRLRNGWDYKKDDGTWPKFVEIDMGEFAESKQYAKIVMSPHELLNFQVLLNHILMKETDDTSFTDNQ